MSDADYTPQKQKEYLDKLILDLVKEGKDINEILAMPFYFLVEILHEKNKPRQEKSLIAAFGG